MTAAVVTPVLATVLVYGETSPITDLLRRIVERLGAAVVTASEASFETVCAQLDPPPELILVDAHGAAFDPVAACQRMLKNPVTHFTPVLFFNAPNTPKFALDAFNAGAQDLLTAPFDPTLALVRIRLHRQFQAQRRGLVTLIAQRSRELQNANLGLMQKLRNIAEFKDDDSGTHLNRVSHMARLFAQEAGLEAAEVEHVFQAMPLHDIGHIGIPDRILLKTTALTPEEWRIMRLHPGIGASIIGKHDDPVLKVARQIALTHHEKWDGSGYPRGLRGEQIPMAGRIAALCDTFDVLTSSRPHKTAWPVDNAVTYLRDQAGRHYDPMLVQIFLNVLPEIVKLRQQFPEKPSTLLDSRAEVTD